MMAKVIDDAERGEYEDRIIKLQADNEKLREALECIQNWAQAYPLDIFPKPDLKKAHKVLKAADMMLDAISANNMRHVLDGVKNIVGQALKKTDD